MRLSYVITAKSENDPKLNELLKSIEKQEGLFEREILVITEGTSESAKAIGVRRATGDIVCILASDNEFVNPCTSETALYLIKATNATGAFPAYYHLAPLDNPLNRYFAIIGANDVLALFMGKADRKPQYEYDESVAYTLKQFRERIPTLGDNGFFVRRKCLLQANLDTYYHIDVCEDIRRLGHYTYAQFRDAIWHKTGECSLFDFFRRRARFGTQHAFNPDRRWHLVSKSDTLRLLWFIVASTTLVYPTYQGVKMWLRSKDIASMLHPLMCFGTLLTYGWLVISHFARSLFPSSSAPTVARKA